MDLGRDAQYIVVGDDKIEVNDNDNMIRMSQVGTGAEAASVRSSGKVRVSFLAESIHSIMQHILKSY